MVTHPRNVKKWVRCKYIPPEHFSVRSVTATWYTSTYKKKHKETREASHQTTFNTMEKKTQLESVIVGDDNLDS